MPSKPKRRKRDTAFRFVETQCIRSGLKLPYWVTFVACIKIDDNNYAQVREILIECNGSPDEIGLPTITDHQGKRIKPAKGDYLVFLPEGLAIIEEPIPF